MTIAEAAPDFEADRNDRAFLGHPKGLGYLAFVQGCERFSYYSMQTLLVLYMVKYLLLPENAAGVIVWRRCATGTAGSTASRSRRRSSAIIPRSSI